MTRNCPCCQSLTCPASAHNSLVLMRLREALTLLELWQARAANTDRSTLTHADLSAMTDVFLDDVLLRSLDDSPPSQG